MMLNQGEAFICLLCYVRPTNVFVFFLVCLDSDPSSSVQIVYPKTPKTVSIEKSQPLTLECVVSGSPAPAAKWFKNGKVIPGPSHQRQHNNLAFVRAMRSDEGSYTCAVETEQGTLVSANYTVKVLGKKNTMREECEWWLFDADV